MKELIASGEAGRPVLFHGHYSCNSLHTPWWINVDLCGGQIYEQAIHVYDLCRYLMGEPKYAAGVMGNVCHNHIHNYTVEDVSTSFAGFTNGAVAAITANNCEVPGEWIGRFKVVYEKVTADFCDFNHAVFTYTGEGDVYKRQVWEVTQKDYTKATGIRFMCSHLDADMENCFAVGDSENDLDMLKAVKNSIAMGNAKEEILPYCSYVTKGIEEDGIHYALKHYGII